MNPIVKIDGWKLPRILKIPQLTWIKLLEVGTSFWRWQQCMLKTVFTTIDIHPNRVLESER